MSPYRTFDSISKFAELLAKFKKDQFVPRVTTHNITENTEVILIEPACGSNTAVIRSFGKILLIDSGYTFYAEEMRGILQTLISDYDTIPKSLLLTHADVEHCGMMNDFDEVFVSHNSAFSLTNEGKSENGFREQNPSHKPYVNICKILTSYATIDPKKMRTPWQNIPNLHEPLNRRNIISMRRF